VASTLHGVRVLDLSRMLAGPYGSMTLADMGAEVIKIEQPDGGDPIRRMGPPFLEGESAYFLGINRNKGSVTLNLRSDAGRDLFLELVAQSDVVYDNFRPGVMARLGLDRESLVGARPDIISCSVSSFGPTGPYKDQPAFDLTLQALGGGMSITGPAGGDPVRMGLPVGDLAGGMFAAQAICAALFRRERTGEGQHIDVALLDVQVSMLTYVAQYHFADGRVPGPMGTGHDSVVPYQAFATADRPIVVAVFVTRFWQALCDVIGIPEYGGRFPTALDRFAARDEVIATVAERLLQRTAEEWIAELWEAGVPSAPIQTVDQVLTDPQVLHREMVVSTEEHPTVGSYKTLGNPVKTDEAEPDTFAPAPLLGEDNRRMLVELLGHTDEELAAWRRDGVV
jgi:crotonobetainyl-CoA:carnitine CoA-transferase CaiB-like acyl-CoA transferase